MRLAGRSVVVIRHLGGFHPALRRDTPGIGQRGSVSTTVVVRRQAQDDRGVAHYTARRALRNSFPSTLALSRGRNAGPDATPSRPAPRPRGGAAPGRRGDVCTERAPDGVLSALRAHVAEEGGVARSARRR